MQAELSSDMSGGTKTQAATRSSNVNFEEKEFSEEKVQLLHQLVAKLLYPFRCTRQDIQTTMAFLCTRVQLPDKDG